MGYWNNNNKNEHYVKIKKISTFINIFINIYSTLTKNWNNIIVNVNNRGNWLWNIHQLSVVSFWFFFSPLNLELF